MKYTKDILFAIDSMQTYADKKEKFTNIPYTYIMSGIAHKHVRGDYICAALLYPSTVSVEEMEKQNLPYTVIDAVKILRSETESMEDYPAYIREINENEIAKTIKAEELDFIIGTTTTNPADAGITIEERIERWIQQQIHCCTWNVFKGISDITAIDKICNSETQKEMAKEMRMILTGTQQS